MRALSNCSLIRLTCPIRNRLRDVPEDSISLSFGNDVYQITFDDRSKFPAFGHRYTFFLQDAVENVPEYIVQWDAFVAYVPCLLRDKIAGKLTILSLPPHSLAAEYCLTVLYHEEFHDVFNKERETPEFAQLLVKMKVITQDGESELTEEQWEAASESLDKAVKHN